MKVFHYTGEYVKIESGGVALAYNPPSKESSLLLKTKKPANVVISSINYKDFNGILQVADKDSFIITGAGEYEVFSFFVHGVQGSSAYENKKYLGKENLINTMYTVTSEGINLVFLGALKSKDDMNYKIVEDLESVDVLFVPIGGGEVLTPQEAYSLAISLEAKVVIPIHFSGIGSESALGEFLKEAGKESLQSVDKYTFKKKDISDFKNEIVVIQS